MTDTCAYCNAQTFHSNLTTQGEMMVCHTCITEGANYYTYRCIDCEEPDTFFDRCDSCEEAAAVI